MLPSHPIDYVLARQRKDPHPDVWRLRPQPWKAVSAITFRHLAEKEAAIDDPVIRGALFLRQQEEMFLEAVLAHVRPDGTEATDADTLLADVQRLATDDFYELIHAARSDALLKAGAKNWPGSSSNGAATPATQEPSDSATPSTAAAGNGTATPMTASIPAMPASPGDAG